MSDLEDSAPAERRRQVTRAEDRAREALVAQLAAADHDLLVTLHADMRHLESLVGSLVSRLEFAPVKMIAYGMVGLVLSGVLASLLALVIRGK